MIKHPIELLESRIAPAGISSIDLGSLNGINGFKLNGSGTLQVGYSISSAGDVNGDGFDDVVIGGPKSTGAAYVVFGRKDGLPPSLNLTSLDGTNGFRLTAEGGLDELGFSVDGAGDFNGDGYEDIIIGANRNSGVRGAAYIIYGHAGSFPATIALGSLNGILGSKITTSVPGDLLGDSVAGAGDVNGDGYDDVVIGGSGVKDNGLANNGAAFVIFGKPAGLGATFSVDSLNGSNGFRASLSTGVPNLVGRSVAGGGDINGDGYADVIVSANGASEGGTSRGAAFVIYGKGTPYTSYVDLNNLSGSSGFRISGATDSTRLGDSVAHIGDVNGDGYDDFSVGAFAGVSNLRGAAYVIFGRPGGFGSGMLNTDVDGSNGFLIVGAQNNDFLGTVGGPIDFNGDGFDDILVAASNATELGAMSGATYVVYGHAGTFGPLNIASLNGTNGLKLRGAAGDDFSGSAVGGGDFNGDGFDDVYVGAPNAGVTDSGAGYVVFGTGTKVTISKNGRIATFQDVDGDLVTVKVSKGVLNRSDIVIDPGGSFQKLSLLDKHGAFAGATVSITAKKLPGGTGDGRINVGAVDARGSDLASVVIGGDLGQIDCGDANLLTPALGSLVAGSIGTVSNSQPFGTIDPFNSRIEGSVKSIKVGGDMAGVLNIAGNVNAVRIGGNLDGAKSGTAAGLIRATGNIGSVTVARDVLGGADFAGILSGGKLGTVAIGGNLTSTPSKPVHIAALGKLNPTSIADAVAIKSVTIGGGTLYGKILAGYTTGLVPLNGDAGIGSVTINKVAIATSVAAGVADTSAAGNLASTPNGFGRNDTALGGGNPNILARIASITLKLPPAGTMSAVDSFAFTAEVIGKAKVFGATVALDATKNFVVINPPQNDLAIVEV